MLVCSFDMFLVVVEEAAEVLETHIVTSLTKSCQQVILIGKYFGRLYCTPLIL